MPTHYRGTPAEQRALSTFIKLMRATDALGARVGQGLAGEGVTPPQLAVLEALLHLGPMHACDLGEKLLRSKANMTTVLDNLEKSGLVKRERGTDDRRFVKIHLTPRGRQRIEKVFPAHATRITESLGALTPEEQEHLGALCKKLGTALRAT